MPPLPRPTPPRPLASARLRSAVAVVSLATAGALLLPVTAAAHGDHGDRNAPAAGQAPVPEAVRREIDPQEVKNLGQSHAEEHARTRAALRDIGDYPNPTRVERLKQLTESQRKLNDGFGPKVYGRFAEYFPSPDYAVHIAQLPTGKILLFSFEPVEDNPQKETAPTNTPGGDNAGRAFLWDPARGTGRDAFKQVTPPVVDMPDGLDQPRPAPFFCAGHSFLPNGMLGVFGGNLGGNGGSGAKLSLVFDPWTETWHRNGDMAVGRWYPSVVTGADGRQLIFSGHTEIGWSGTPSTLVERFPAKSHKVPWLTTDRPHGVPVESLRTTAPFTLDYPQLFSMRDGLVYALGRKPAEQFTFDPVDDTRDELPARPDGVNRLYGGAVPMPGGHKGPEAALVIGGDRDSGATWRLSRGRWTKDTSRAFGRTQDNTLLLPDGSMATFGGSFDVRDYGNGLFNPNADLKYRQIELRDADGKWSLGPAQRLPRGYHGNAVVMPDGRIMVTGDELQQIANDPDIRDDMHGSIEIYEPAYLHRGPRPDLRAAPTGPIRYGRPFQVGSRTADRVKRAVLLAPTTATHAVNTSQRHVELLITKREGDRLTLQSPPDAAAATPGFHMLFLLDADGVPSVAQWVKLEPADLS
ncbi:galactose oxidase-like domain-containing protein (plasmid) [Streptomyces sp. BI20]|uniref:galactose oxidase-like domain-containing protein n=1 Tax=Streptomyces sp. BI20 TaxID=3403460 RepID=UPI003C782129